MIRLTAEPIDIKIIISISVAIDLSVGIPQ